MTQLALQYPIAAIARPPVLRVILGDDEVIVDNFAGGGGASCGLEQATGRSPDIAVNHDPEAIAMHTANHPTTRHYCESVWDVDPVAACGGRPVALAWFSPDCKHHSKAKGGKPRDQKIRGLAWDAVSWAAKVRPRVIILENVEEFKDWGPLYRDHSNGCTGEVRERRIAGRSRETIGCRKGCHHGKPIPERKGETFNAFQRRLTRLGYQVEWRLLRASDYGAPTSRRRLFLMARCDGKPNTWPAATHGPGRAKPHRTAAEIIDWSIPCPSIFDRKKPLADATMARIARGVRKFVVDAGAPFIVPSNTNHLAIPYLVHRSNGERPGQLPRIYDILKPIGTQVAQGQKQALCVAFLARHYGDRPTGGWAGAADLRVPIPTITTRDHHALVAALLVRYNGTGQAEPVDRPIGTLTCKDRYGLVTVTIAGEHYEIVDIGMRMLSADELFAAQGFPPDYKIHIAGPTGKRLSKTAQVRMGGNSVCPPMSKALASHALAA